MSPLGSLIYDTPSTSYGTDGHELLKKAIKAAEENNTEVFFSSLNKFEETIGHPITPERLDKDQRALYTKALFQALSYSDIQLNETRTQKTLQFIRYDIEESPENQFAMDKLNEFRQGIPQDDKKAKCWYEKSAERGNTTAMYNLGGLFGNKEV